MRRIAAIYVILVIWTGLRAQSLSRSKMFLYGDLLFAADSEQVIGRIQGPSAMDFVFLDSSYGLAVDSSDVYGIDLKSLRVRDTLKLFKNSVSIPKYLVVRSGNSYGLYVVQGFLGDTVRILHFKADSLWHWTVEDTIQYVGYKSVYDVFLASDSTGYVVLYRSGFVPPGVLQGKFKFLRFGADSLESSFEDSIVFSSQTYVEPFRKLEFSVTRQKCLLLTRGNVLVFNFSSDLQSINSVNILSGIYLDAEFSSSADYVYLIYGKDLLRYDLVNNREDTLKLKAIIKNIALLPDAKIAVVFQNAADTVLGLVYNTEADSMKNIYFRYSQGRFESPGWYFLRVHKPRPWFDFSIERLNKTDFEFTYESGGSSREPDTIQWFINGHFIKETQRGGNQLDYKFLRKGLNLVSAVGRYRNSGQQITVSHYLYQYYSVFPNLILADTMVYCDTPSYKVDFVQYSANSDSIVWTHNGEKYGRFYDRGKVVLKEPGLYTVSVYRSDTILRDTVYICYRQKLFSRRDIKILVNDIAYDEGVDSSMLLCTNIGVVNFRVFLPRDKYCPQQYTYYWYFGDGAKRVTVDSFVSHRYLRPGFYQVFIWIVNDRTGAEYNLELRLNVSISPIVKCPKFVNVPKLSFGKLRLGKDVVVAKCYWRQPNIFYGISDSTGFNQEINFDVTPKVYSDSGTRELRFFSYISCNKASRLRILLVNPAGDTAIIQDTVVGKGAPIFFGLPYVGKRLFGCYQTSDYEYYWDNSQSLTFNYIWNTYYPQTEFFAEREYYLEDIGILHYRHYWTNRLGLAWVENAQSKLSDSLVGRWRVLFQMFPTDSSEDYLHTWASGIVLSPRYERCKNKIWWESDMPIFHSNPEERPIGVSDSALWFGNSMTGKYYLTLHVKNQYGCEYTSKIDVYVLDTLEAVLPNAFTPNGDGFNDRWSLEKAFFAQIYVQHTPVYVRIWNKQGKIVAKFLANDRPWWDGTDMSGRLVPPGVYWYMIIVGNKQVYKGSVTVIY